jgi:hypothetical protein
MKLSPSEFSHIFAELEERADEHGERRRHSRIVATAPVRVVDVASRRQYGAITRDISFSGVSLIQAEALMPSTGSQLVVSLPHKRNRPYLARCVVIGARRVAEGICCVGCEFTAFDKDAELA